MTGISTLSQALNQIDRIKDQQSLLDTLGQQFATGKKTQVFSGLKGDVVALQRARASFASLETYSDNITHADRRIKYTLTTIEEFQQQAENFAAALSGFNQQSAHQSGDVVYYDDPLTTSVEENTIIGYSESGPDVELEVLQDLANNLYDFMVDLINTKDGDRYILNGAETQTPPLIDSGVLDTAISTQIAAWQAGTITTDDLIADLSDRTVDDGNLDAFTDTVVGFSPTLSAGTAGKTFVRVEQTTEIDTTVLANDQGFRDILVALSYFKSADLGPIVDEVEIDPITGLSNIITEGAPGADLDEMTDNFYEVFNVLSAKIGKALDDVDQQRFKLESARARITEIKLNHEQEQHLLQSSIDEIENVDINEVAIQLSAISNQLEASYGVTARIQQLSLVNFL